MATNISLIQPRRVDFGTQANADWLDGVPVTISGAGGVETGSTNVGNGALTVASIAAFAAIGAHTVTVTSTDGMTRITVTDPAGNVTGQGVTGLSLSAGGITFTLAQGSTPFAVGDAFAIGVLPVPLNIAGIDFDMQVRASATSAAVALTATSHPSDGSLPTIVAGTTGNIAMRMMRAAMSADVFPPGTYVYDIIATADGMRVPAFFGTIEHVYGVTYLL